MVVPFNRAPVEAHLFQLNGTAYTIWAPAVIEGLLCLLAVIRLECEHLYAGATEIDLAAKTSS